jgi:amidase
LKAQGAMIVDPFEIPDLEALTKNIFCGDFQSDLNSYLEKHGQGAPYRTLSAIIDSGLYLPYIENRLKSTAAAKPGSEADHTVCPDVYHNERKIAFRAAIRAAMASYRVQAAITVPMGYTHGELPAGLTFLGDAFDEGALIKFAYAYEQATKHRHAPPKFSPLN